MSVNDPRVLPFGANGQPLGPSQEQLRQQQAIQAQQLYLSCYLSLVPAVAADELRKADGQLGVEPNLDRIAIDAKRIAVRAMKEIGVSIEG